MDFPRVFGAFRRCVRFLLLLICLVTLDLTSPRITGENIWGRGSIDMKSKCAMDLGLAVAIRRAGAQPDRDLIIAAVADEEAGSELGARYLVDRHPDLVRAGFVLNETGGFTLHLGERRFYPIQVAEKGFVTVKMTVSGAPGHGSMPRSDTAIGWMGDLIGRLGRKARKSRLTAGRWFNRHPDLRPFGAVFVTLGSSMRS